MRMNAGAGLKLALAAVGVAGALGLMAAGPVTMAPAPQPALVQVAQAADQATLMREGAPLYTKECAICHGANGQGGDGPKLAGNTDLKNGGGVASQILQGAVEHGMPPFADVLKDGQIAAITTFVMNSWGNSYGVFTPEQVASMRGGR